jgi:hypothetical protein
VTADTRRQPAANLIASTRRANRVSAALIGLTVVYAAWQIAFRPAVDRWQLIIELGVIVGLAASNIAASRMIRSLAAVTILMLTAVHAAAAAADQPSDDGS